MAKIHSQFKTAKGTVLDLIDLKGKPYLMAANRLVWFREAHPTGIIKTQLLHHQDDTAVFKAEIFINGPNSQPMLVATAHKVETKTSFPDYVEKAETSAIARALAMAGFGTQFTGDELDEGDRLADSPINPAKKDTPKKTSSLRARVEAATTTGTNEKDNVVEMSHGDDI